MQRNLEKLANDTFDLVVVGGGITGACVAWDATLRGLRVALVEKRDFGSATSSNSLKTIHGGLRYLQDGNLRIVRKMIRERQALLRIAPHLAHPLPVVMPTTKNKLTRSKLVLGTAVKLNDLLSLDRNWGSDPQKVLPNGRLFSRTQIRQMLPRLNDANVSGGVMWHDAQVYNTERLLLAFVRSAAAAGAQAANYVGVTGLLRDGDRVTGVTAVDQLTGQSLQIQAGLVVNAAGPWIDELLGDLTTIQPKFHLSSALNLVTRQILPDYAVGLSSRYSQPLPDGSSEQRSRVLFIAPWRDYSLVGTLHAPYNGRPDDQWTTETIIADFLAEVNGAYPGANLNRQDVYHVHRGFLPMIPDAADPTTVKLVREGQVTDHAAEDGIDGLVTAMGVKYTTARYLAEKTVDLACKKLGRPSPPCQTRQKQLVGGQITDFAAFMTEAGRKLPSSQQRHLLYNYGSEVWQLLQDGRSLQPIAPETAVTPAEIYHAIQSEMAQTLSDVILRRTEMGSAGPPPPAAVHACAAIMAAECGWDQARIHQEIEAVWASYPDYLRPATAATTSPSFAEATHP